MPTFKTAVEIVESRPIHDGLHWETTVKCASSNFTMKSMFFNVHEDNLTRDENNTPNLPSGNIEVSFNLALSYDKHNEEYLQEIFCKFL